MSIHKQTVPVRAFSRLAPFAGLILSMICILLFMVRYYVLESFLLRRCYGARYLRLNDVNRRGFVNHHIAGAMKALIFIVAVYPFLAVTFARATLHSAYTPHSIVTMGDVLLVCSQMLMAIYAFELIYRPRISPVAAAHHIGAIMVGQSSIAMSINYAHEQNADIEFILCCVWGAFDIVFELLPHVAIILYRLRPGQHIFLRNLFLTSAVTTFVGTVFETITVFVLFGSLWDKWRISFKVVTPILHVVFAATQLHGSRIFWKLYRRQQRILSGHESDEEQADDKTGKPDGLEDIDAEGDGDGDDRPEKEKASGTAATSAAVAMPSSESTERIEAAAAAAAVDKPVVRASVLPLSLPLPDFGRPAS
ncbi:MAG: hypothetical protein M1826_003861 [Phylliscum demangeonii]|nr:MAG: hypothetical protein M1826_003861 [Phylliscum demangeonii]